MKVNNPLFKNSQPNIRTELARQSTSNFFRREYLVREIIKNNALPTIDNIIYALKGDKAINYINTKTLLICENIYISGIEIKLPLPNSTYVKGFKDVVGSAVGAYYIYPKNKIESYSHVGQSIKLSSRVRALKKIEDFFNWWSLFCH